MAKRIKLREKCRCPNNRLFIIVLSFIIIFLLIELVIRIYNLYKTTPFVDILIYLFTGRPGISKGLKYLINAVPYISKKVPNSKLLAIVSKDKTYEKQYNKILRLIKKLGVEDKVILHDPVSYKELPKYVKLADCVVVPSLAEGFGFVAAEACAMGVPVVASNTTSLPEVVSGKFILVKPRDFNGIAKAVENIKNGKFLF